MIVQYGFWMFILILVFILVSRAGNASQVINTIAGAVTQQTKALQGVTYPGQGALVQ